VLRSLLYLSERIDLACGLSLELASLLLLFILLELGCIHDLKTFVDPGYGKRPLSFVGVLFGSATYHLGMRTHNERAYVLHE
jgi:hypothetical protein